jgi:hypothetical protein
VALSPEAAVAVSADAALGASVEALSVAAFCCEPELVVAEPVELPVLEVTAVLTVLPENDCAATAEIAPVTVTLPASSRRLMRVSLRSAASLDFTSAVIGMGSVSTACLRRV